MKKITLFASVLLSLEALAQTPSAACSFNYSSSAKPCPTSGTTLLDDTYPVASYVISVAPQRNSPTAMKVPADFVLSTLRAHNFSANSPSVIIPSTPESYNALRAELSQRIAASNGAIPASVLDKVVPAEPSGRSGQNWTWQQDYFESFFDPATGRPVVRQVESYSRASSTATQNLASSGAGCGITNGPQIASVTRPASEPLTKDQPGTTPDSRGNTYSFDSGEMGGNIEGLPGGLCLVGDNIGSVFSSQFCGSPANVVQIDVSWLNVGHVDEVVKVIPTNRPGVPAECNFSLMFASPKKARELLRDPAKANHPAFSGDFLRDSATPEQLREFRESRAHLADGELCRMMDYIRTIRNPQQNSPGKGGKKGSGSQAFYFIKELLIPTAHAGNARITPAQSSACEVDTITNSEFLAALEQPKYKEFNDAVDRVMEENKRKIMAKILERLPQCRPYLVPVEAPNLFFGTLQENSDGTKKLVRGSAADAFMPNPTNSVVANRNIIFSDPQNPLFRDYLSSQLRPLGMTSSFIDTWDYSHVGNGNLHCSSHSIPYCAPRGR